MTEVEALIRAGKLDQALELAKNHLAAARERDEPATLAAALVDEARAELAHGDRDLAVMTVDEAISRTRRAHGARDPRHAEALELGAEIAARADMPNSAEARFRSAVEILEGLSVVGAPLLHTLLRHGCFRATRGDVAAAARAFLAVIARGRELSDPESLENVAGAFTELGELALAERRAAEARALGDRALEIWLALGRARRSEVADGMALVGRAALDEGDATAAVGFLEPACEIYRGVVQADRVRRAAAARGLAAALDACGRVAEAQVAYRAALDLYREGADERLEIEQRLLELARR
jgi:tetratricopeptide (TPR) repeat protein